MGDRELGRRLDDHLEQRAGAGELERQLPRLLAGAKRGGGADAERPETGDLLGGRLPAVGVDELENARGRVSERQPRRALWQCVGGNGGLGERDPVRGDGYELGSALLPE